MSNIQVYFRCNRHLFVFSLVQNIPRGSTVAAGGQRSFRSSLCGAAAAVMEGVTVGQVFDAECILSKRPRKVRRAGWRLCRDTSSVQTVSRCPSDAFLSSFFRGSLSIWSSGEGGRPSKQLASLLCQPARLTAHTEANTPTNGCKQCGPALPPCGRRCYEALFTRWSEDGGFVWCTAAEKASAIWALIVRLCKQRMLTSTPDGTKHIVFVSSLHVMKPAGVGLM